MFWIPGLPILIFILLLIPFIIYGYKKGWLHSVIFFFVLWFLTLGFIGLNYFLYKYLWKFFSSFILKKTTNDLINLEYLSQFYKTQIILFVTGLELILIYPITFLIMFLINKKTNKYLGHKIRPISKNKKEIIYRRNIKASRISGAVILTTGTIFSTSLIASFFNVAFTPYKKSNIFNSTNDVLGQIYSLGLAKNSKTAQIISNFINNNLNKNLADSVNELINIQSDENKDNSNIFPNKSKINNFEQNFFKFKDLFKDEEAVKAVFLSIIKTQKNSINLLAFDNNTINDNKDSNENIIGYDKNDPLDNINKFREYVSKNKLKVKLSDFLIQLLVKTLEKRFIDFNNLLFYKEYKIIENQKKYSILTLAQRKQFKKSFLTQLQSRKEERQKVISVLENISGTRLDSPDYTTNDFINFPIHTLNKTSPGMGVFKAEIDKEEQKLQIKQEKLKSKNDKTLDYDNYFINDYSNEKEKMDNKKKTYDEAKINLQTFKVNLKSLIQRVQTKKNDIQILNNQIQALTNSINNLQNKIQELENKSDAKTNPSIITQIDNLKTELNSKNTQLTEKQTKLTENQNQLSLLETNKQQKKEEIQRQENTILPNARTEWNQIKLDFQSFENQKNQLENIKINVEKEYNDSLQEYNDQKQITQRTQRTYANSFKELEEKNNNIQYIDNEIKKLNNIDNSVEFIGPARKWLFIDNGSIFYQENIVKFYEAKTLQLNQIVNRKKLVYKDMKSKILSMYKEMLGG